MNIPKTSRAAVFYGAGQLFELREFAIPTLAPGDILVKVAMCTVCASDLHTYSGRRTGPSPVVLGHEIVGALAWPPTVTDGLGRNVRSGERLIWSLAISCRDCVFCKRNLPQKCESLLKYGHQALSPEWSLSGGLSEYCVLRAGTFFVGIPEDMPNNLAAPASCATATVAAALNAAGDLRGARVLMLGAGPLGLTACAMLDAAGAKQIIVADANIERAQHALQFGATDLVHATLPVKEFAHAVQDVSRQYGADIVLELAGENSATQRAIRSTRPGGQCLLIGSVYPQEPLAISVEDIVRRMLILRGIYNYAPADLSRAVTFLLEHGHRYPLQSMVGEVFPLEEVEEAFDFAGSAAVYRVAVCPVPERRTE